MKIHFLFITAIVVSALTVDDLGLTEENCKQIRDDPSSFGFVPCPCRINTASVRAVACYPHCCPKTSVFEGDRCHVGNRLSWSVYEQQVCFESPPKETLEDTPNCFYRGNIPHITSATVTASSTRLEFELSILDSHICNNLYLTTCDISRLTNEYYRIDTADGEQCWLRCSPEPLAPCTEFDCWAHRGETPSVIRHWTIPRALFPGDYALVCFTMVKGQSVGTELFQGAYASKSFKIH